MRHGSWLVVFCFLIGCSLLPTPSQKREVASGKAILDGSGYLYTPADTSCGGYPALKVQTQAGTCLGLVVSQNDFKFIMPRTILAIPGTEDFFIVDMGGWAPRRGSLYHMQKKASGYSFTAVMSKLNTPHGLVYSEKDGHFYVGENERIVRFTFEQGRMGSIEVVADNLPAMEGHMHPLTQFVFDPTTNDLYVNSGSPSDHCQEEAGGKQLCSEDAIEGMASINRISGTELLRKPFRKVTQITKVAAGLRNSMAMAIPTGGNYLVQGENSRDFPELEEPYEEINVVYLDPKIPMHHYGWPYCYNFHATSPEWLFAENRRSLLAQQFGEKPFDCGTSPIKGFQFYRRPHSLIPPHAAPLHADYYRGEMFPHLQNHLLMSWHGHRTTGQRFVSYATDAKGLPVIRKATNRESYNVNQPSGCAQRADFLPRGRFPKHADYSELISGWGPVKGLRPKGAPTGFAVANDGSIFIVEDKNKTIVRLTASNTTYADKCSGPSPKPVDDANIPLLVWRDVLLNDSHLLARYQFIASQLMTDKYCMGCHENFINKDLKETPDALTAMDFLIRSNWVHPGKPDTSPLYGALRQNGIVPAMPPKGKTQMVGTPEGEKIISEVELWIRSLPTDIDQRYKQVTIAKNLNIRQGPSKQATVCGMFVSEDAAYIDPRRETQVKAEGITWSRVYIVPKHSRLFLDKCPDNGSGVYYIAY